MTDDDFLAAVARQGFAAHEFRHPDHLRLAYLAVRRHGAVTAETVVGDAIRALAHAHGHAAKYNDTLSRAWVRVVALAMSRHRGASFEDLLSAHPQLLDKHLLLEHYTRSALFGPRARVEWVPPDVLPIPAVAGAV